MDHIIGIRREDKNEWEKRVPLVPSDVQYLKDFHGIDVYVQPSDIRVYSNGEYKEAGARISEDLSPCEVMFGVKEMPVNFLQAGGTYVFFSHTLKGQHYNMPLLQRLLDLNCNLIDYEGIVDENNRRLIFFGQFAGQAGAIDAIWALGEKLKIEGIETPFYELRQTHNYRHLKAAKGDLKMIAEQIIEEGLHQSMLPVVFGVTGYGNVSKGVQDILDVLPIKEITPQELLELKKSDNYYSRHVYKVVFKEEDMVKPKDPFCEFDLMDYYENPDKYQSIFHQYLPHLTILFNCIFWVDKYPRLVTRDSALKLYKNNEKKLRVIADISCDINGAIEMNTHVTDPGNPVYMFDPVSGNTKNGLDSEGIVILAVDNLPCELPKESSIYFSNILREYVPQIVNTDFSKPFKELDLPREIKQAIIVHQGKLTEKYSYLQEALNEKY